MIKFNKIKYFILSALLVSSIFCGCQEKDKGGFQKLHWDRDMCEQCKMVISERKYAVEVVNPNNGKAYKFDDLGCAIEWLRDNKISWEKEAKIYITDKISGRFIDAKNALYDVNSRTPMDYGFGAYSKQDMQNGKKFIYYEEVRLKILRGETMQNPAMKNKAINPPKTSEYTTNHLARIDSFKSK